VRRTASWERQNPDSGGQMGNLRTHDRRSARERWSHACLPGTARELRMTDRGGNHPHGIRTHRSCTQCGQCMHDQYALQQHVSPIPTVHTRYGRCTGDHWSRSVLAIQIEQNCTRRGSRTGGRYDWCPQQFDIASPSTPCTSGMHGQRMGQQRRARTCQWGRPCDPGTRGRCWLTRFGSQTASPNRQSDSRIRGHCACQQGAFRIAIECTRYARCKRG